MNRKLIILLAAAFAWFLCGAAAIRWVQTVPYPKRKASFVDSPNGRNRAHVARVSENHFFTGIKNYYDFRVEMTYGDAGMVQIHHEEVPPDRVSVDVDMDNLEETIKWSEDSYVVTFFTGKRNIKVVVPL